MKKIFCFLMMFITACVAASAENAFQQVLSLRGTWEGRLEGDTIQIEFQPISDQGAVMEKMTFPSGTSMTSVYYPSDGKLMMTHFCKSNQPRLASIPTEEGALKFEFIDGANHNEKHLTELQLRLINENQLEQKIRFNGNPSVLTIVYTRKQ